MPSIITQLWNYIDFEYKGQSDLFNEEVCHIGIMYIDIMYIIGYILQDKYIHDPNPSIYDYMLWIITYSTLLFERSLQSMIRFYAYIVVHLTSEQIVE